MGKYKVLYPDAERLEELVKRLNAISEELGLKVSVSSEGQGILLWVIEYPIKFSLEKVEEKIV